jgi:lysozyme
MTPSKNCIDLIKKFEGLRLEAYQCPAGVWTIGWGSTGPGIREGLVISENTAHAMITGHVREIGISLSDMLGRAGLLHYGSGLSQNQFDALTSFVYNIGIGAFKKSTMYGLLRDKLYNEAAREFDRWVHAGGKELPGLVSRRAAEKELFLR